MVAAGGNVLGEHQAAWWRLGPSPLADVVQEAVDGDDPLALFLDRDRPSASGSGRAGVGGQVGLDVPAAIELGEALDVGVDRREVPAEEPEVRHGPADGRMGVRRPKPLDVGDEARKDRRRDSRLRESLLECLRRSGWPEHRWAVEDPEVVKRGACREQHPTVMSRRPVGAPVAVAEGNLELVEILSRQFSEWLAGLDQEACCDEAACAAGDGVGEPKLAGCRNESLLVVVQRACGEPRQSEMNRRAIR